MKKFLILIILFTFTTSAFASWAPLAIPAAYWVSSAVIHSATATAGLYYSLTGGKTSSVDNTAKLSRPATVAYIDLTMTTPTVVETNIKASILKSQLEQKILNSPVEQAKYPNIYQALITPPPPYPAPTANMPSGTKVSFMGGNYKITTTVLDVGWAMNTDGSYPKPNNPTDTAPYSMAWVRESKAFPGFAATYLAQVYLTPEAAPPPSVATDASYIQAVGTGGVPGDVKSLYNVEIDKLLNDPNYVPSFSDATTGLPYSPPPGANIMTPTQLEAYNRSGQLLADDAAAKLLAANSAGAAAAAGTAATTAGNNYTASGGNTVTGTGGDPALYQKYLDALASAGTAKATADKLAADQAAAKLAEDKANKQNSAITSPAVGDSYGAGEKFEIGTRFNLFMTDMKSSGIFALPSQLLGNVPGGGQSYFDVSFGRMGSTRFDLSSFASAIAVMRTLVLIVFSFTGFKIVTLKGGSG